jgi:hypothetical protein
MDMTEEVADLAGRIATAIARRDVRAVRALLAPGFIHRTHGGAASNADAFVRAIEQIPGDIRFVRLEQVAVDLCGGGALVTGVQFARLVIDGKVVDDKRGFVDWFVKDGEKWRIQAAVDLPAPR